MLSSDDQSGPTAVVANRAMYNNSNFSTAAGGTLKGVYSCTAAVGAHLNDIGVVLLYLESKLES